MRFIELLLVGGSRLLLAAVALSVAAGAQAQVPSKAPVKLTVVIAIDQFRADYLRRFQAHFGAGG
ncbi:MAG TPA: hypothetical protein VE399_01020, partial [Gemmatimonadales bacterium]|nr:hypothetical protein [Gemmatimonadales bacterium]